MPSDPVTLETISGQIWDVKVGLICLWIVTSFKLFWIIAKMKRKDD